MASTRIDVRRLESKITEEHLEIRATLERLQGVADPAIMLIVLEDLHRQFESHFNREEGEKGLHTIVEMCAPQYAERVDALLLEHRLLTNELTKLIRDCRALISGPLARLRSDASGFVEHLTSHDVAETEILTDCMLREMERPRPPSKTG